MFVTAAHLRQESTADFGKFAHIDSVFFDLPSNNKRRFYGPNGSNVIQREVLRNIYSTFIYFETTFCKFYLTPLVFANVQAT